MLQESWVRRRTIDQHCLLFDNSIPSDPIVDLTDAESVLKGKCAVSTMVRWSEQEHWDAGAEMPYRSCHARCRCRCLIVGANVELGAPAGPVHWRVACRKFGCCSTTGKAQPSPQSEPTGENPHEFHGARGPWNAWVKMRRNSIRYLEQVAPRQLLYNGAGPRGGSFMMMPGTV